jgi:cardiolipin synthase A/B
VTLDAAVDDVLAWASVVAMVLAILTAPSVLLQRQGRPTAALSWLLAIFALPYVALPAWWLIGRTHLSLRKRRRRHATARFTRELASLRSRPRAAVERGVFPVLSLPAEVRASVFPPSARNEVKLLVDGAATFEAWEAAIRAAREHVHLLFYIWESDEVGKRMLSAAIEAARRGVEVRVLYDALGTPRGKRTFRDLVAAGGRAEAFMPMRLSTLGPSFNFRNHRKLIVIDGEVAYTGGINVGDEYLTWHDLAIELRGPSVDQAQEVFCDDWFFATGEDLADPKYFERFTENESDPAGCAIVASGPTEHINATRDMVFVAMVEAKKRLWIMTPYLIPDPAMVLALRVACYRGVDVRLLVPGRSDVWLVRRASRAFYPELAESGVRIFEYPGMIHAKAMIVDDALAMVGSANMDTRSFRLNFEIACFVASGSFNAALTAIFESDKEKSREIRKEELGRRGITSRVIDAAAHLLSPIL